MHLYLYKIRISNVIRFEEHALRAVTCNQTSIPIWLNTGPALATVFNQPMAYSIYDACCDSTLNVSPFNAGIDF